jgi:3-O-methylgallate 3,4-dioxygenase
MVMAELILGVASSHSPMVALSGEHWTTWGKRDLQHPHLYTREGRHVTYDQWLAEVGEKYADQTDLETCNKGAACVAAAVETLKQAIAAAKLDVLIIVGDDQDEHLFADNLPPFLVYWGDDIQNNSAESAGQPPMMQQIAAGYREPDDAIDYPVAADLARHIIGHAIKNHFDVAASNQLPKPDRGMGHAFGYTVRRLLAEGNKIVPVMVNTYNPPSQPTALRCREFGSMLRSAIDSFDADMRIGIVASGGLSHFIVLEDFDREVLAAIERRDLDTLCAIPESTYVSGTSEIKNWIATAAVCHDMSFETVDYIPGYRTPAGTGTGLGFGLWR